MGVITLAYLTLALPVVTLCYPDQWLHQIYVDNQTGVNNSSCWEGGYSTPCLSLNLALTGAQHHYNRSTIIFLQPGQHQLYSGSETQLRNMSQLAIVGNGSQGEVVIRCEPLAGLAFFWLQDIELKNVNLVKCGAMQNSTSKPKSFLQIHVAVLFLNCKAIQLTNVHVTMSNGTGAVVYNPVGVVNITSCLFSHNGVSGEQEAMYGGGGLVIEVNEFTSQSSCIITNSIFTHNTASSGQYSYLSPTTSPSGYFGLGRGGGVSVVFRGGAMNNAVQLDGVCLENNMAQFGGGFFLAFYDGTRGNTVSINNAKVTGNEVSLGAGSVLSLTNAIGGGAFIGLASGTTNYPSNNTVIITSSEFIGNEAYTGGGVAVDALFNGYINTSNKLLIENCDFDSNNAIHGSSLLLSQSSRSSPTLLNTTICCSNFTNGNWKHVLLCSGSVFLLSTSLTLKETLIFSGNNCSALSLQSSTVELLPSTQLQFIDNKAINGPALHVIDCSSIVVNDDSTFVFKNNTAVDRGGAIFAESCSLGQAGGSSCFIQHSNTALHPDDWNVSLTFTGNQQLQESYYDYIANSIYMDSINSCIWPVSVKNMRHNTFCWRGWSYLYTNGVTDDDCHRHLQSGPASMYTTLPTNYSLVPGQCIDLSPSTSDFKVYDAWGCDITFDIHLQSYIIIPDYVPVYQDTCTGQYYPCDPRSLCLLPDVEDGDDYSYIHFKVLVYPSQLTGIVFNMSFKPCENGSRFISQEGCVHPGLYYTACENTTSNSWCNTYFYTGCMNTATFLKQLCGSCAADGYGVAFNYPNFICAKCEPHGWAVFIFLQLVPLWIMMILLAVLHINITNGGLNGYILYCQLVSLQFPGLGYSSWLPIQFIPCIFFAIPLIVYSIWNLNFLTVYPIPVCLPHVDTAAGVILLQYVTAACPLVFIIVTYTWIRWYNNGYRFVVYTTRPVHQLLARFWQKFKIQPSLIDTYAGLILISYMRFLTVSAKLLQYIAIEVTTEALINSSKNVSSIDHYVAEHVVLGIVAVLCLLVFVVPPMVVLLLYHLKIFQQCLTRCKLDRPGLHALVDAYQGCFKNSATDGSERRYFAGLYLLFRFCYLVMIVISSSVFVLGAIGQQINAIPLSPSEACLSLVMAGLVVIMRPYKKIAHNVIDFLVLFFLTVIGPLSLMPIIFYVYGLIYIPFVVIFCYVCYHLLKHCCCACVALRRGNVRQVIPGNEAPPTEQQPLLKPPTTSVVTLSAMHDEDNGYADHMRNTSKRNRQTAL